MRRTAQLAVLLATTCIAPVKDLPEHNAEAIAAFCRSLRLYNTANANYVLRLASASPLLTHCLIKSKCH